MSNFFDKWFGPCNKRRQRMANARRLRMESLERRNLMAADFASITGTVYTDLTDDGLTGDDARISGATVRLFRDGGNATFDNGGGDDVSVGTTTTDGSGLYRFDDLIAGTYFVQQDPVTGQVQRASEQVKTIAISPAQAAGVSGESIDTFTTDQTVSGTVIGVPVTSAVVAAEALGGQREMVVNLSADTLIELIANTSTPGVLEFNSSAAGAGTRIVTYDGTGESDAEVVDGSGLGGVDLTNAGVNSAFRFAIGANQTGGNLIIRAYSSATDFSSITLPIDNTGGTAASSVIARFANFVTAGGTGANFSNINALQVEFVVSGANGQLDLIETVSRTEITSNAANLNAMSLGNRVFSDNNNNGVLDTGETGIAGVTVQLYSDTNTNGTYDSGVDTLLDTQTTDSTGNYLFSELTPGDYIAVIPASQFLAAAPLFGYATSSGTAADPDDDVDGDDNGSLVGSDIATAAITLTAAGEPTTDGDSDTNSNLSLDFGFVPQIDVSVVKTDSPDPVVAGAQLTYTLALTNDGPLSATNVVVTDTLPSGTTFVSATSNLGTVTEASGVVTGNLGTMADGQTATITIIVLVGAGQTTSITNTASVTAAEFDTDTTDNSSSTATAVNAVSDLSVVVTDSPDPAVAGGTLTYTITVTNNGPSNATGVTVTDVLPTGVTFASATASQGTATNASGTVTGALGNLASGATATITITATVDPATTGSLSNTATVTGSETDSDSSDNTSSATTAVTQEVDLAITKTDSADPITAGNQLTYTITVTNTGPSDATNVTVTDVLPTGVTFVSANASQGTATNASGTVTGDIGTLASGASATVTIIVSISSSAAAGTLTNTASVSATETDTDSTNNSVSQATVVNRSVDLAITKVDATDPVVAGNNVTYTITVTNTGPSDASGVTVTDVLPTGLTFVSATASQGSASNNSGTVTAALGNLATGASATVTVVATVSGSFSGTLTNTATVTATETDSDPADNSATQTTTINRQVDLRVTTVDNTDPLTAGNSLTYTITVFNDGPSQATNVVVTDILPTGVTFTSATASQGTATNNNGTITGSLGTINSGSSATITIVVASLPSLRTNLTNTASATATETEVDATNNSATATTTVNSSIDLAITKSDSADTVAAGGSLTYTIIVTNNGPSTANAVTVTDVLPSGLTFTSGTATAGTVTNNSGTITGSLGAIAPGSSVTMTIVTAVASSATGTLSNTATVTATETDSNSANNSALQTSSVAQRGSISGTSYVDANRNGVQDAGETGLAGVTIALTGTDLNGSSVSETTTTDSSGAYSFANLLPGTYRLARTQPAGYTSTAVNVGSGAGGNVGSNEITTINLTSGTNATAYNFGDARIPLSKRRFLASSTGNE